MANGDSHHQWDFSSFQPSAQDPSQASTFVDPGFNNDSHDAFTVAQQWQAHDNQFSIEPGFSQYQAQDSGYPTQQPEQHFHGVNGQDQSHQHPQTYTAPIALGGAQDLSWDYGYGFEADDIRGRLGPEGTPYSSTLQQGRNGNGLPSTSSFPQNHDLSSSARPGQHQLRTDPPTNHAYTSSQPSAYGNPPQEVAQSVPQQRQVMDYRQQPAHQQQQQPMPSHHHQPMSPQYQQSMTTHKQQLGLLQHQPAMPQYQQSGPPQHQVSASQQHQSMIPPQRQSTSLSQTSSQQPQQLHTMDHPQQAPRIGTPQSHSLTPASQPRQSPFSGRHVSLSSMQQQAQLANQQGGTSPAVPFSASQLANVPTSMSNSSPSLSNTHNPQSHFMPHQMASTQHPSQSPATPSSISGMSKVMQSVQFQKLQPNASAGTQQNLPQDFHDQFNIRGGQVAVPQEPGVGVLGPPRVLYRNDQGIPLFGSRHVRFASVPILQIDEGDIEAVCTVGELLDPTQVSGKPLGNSFPQHSAEPRPVASDILRNWTKMVDQNDIEGQTAVEKRLQQHLGMLDTCVQSKEQELMLDVTGVTAIPEPYETRLKEAVTLKKKASGKRGPVSKCIYSLEPARSAVHCQSHIQHANKPAGAKQDAPN